MHIRQATVEDIPVIRSIAEITWPVAYGNYISKEQLDYMLQLMYSNETLSAQMENGHRFFLAFNEQKYPAGFAGLSRIPSNYDNTIHYKLHKLYVLPVAQGGGIGNALIQSVYDFIASKEPVWLLLNVNRYNPAIFFYQKLGFEKIGEEDIDIGNGFYMNDFIMRKAIVQIPE